MEEEPLSAANRTAWQDWLDRLRSSDALDRCDAAEAPPEDGEAHEVVAALIPLLHDAHNLVRVAAAERLGCYPETGAIVALREHVHRETDALARAYGLSSLGLVGDDQDIAVLASAITAQSEGIEQVHGLLGLFELARRIAIRRLEAYMTTGSDKIRTGAAAALAQIVRTPQLAEVVDALQRELDKEQSVNRRGYLEGFLRSITRDSSG